MTLKAALAALGLLASLAAGTMPACAGDDPGLDRPPYIAQPPLVKLTPAELQQRIDALTDFPTVLDKRIWTEDHRMRPDVAARTMEIVNQIFTELKLRNTSVAVADIELFGSNASYEYDDHADLGVHVFLSTARNPAGYAEDVLDLEHFMRLLNDAIELKQEGQLRFYGIPVEIVFHATRPPGFRDRDGLPQYSIWSSDASRTGRWINPRNPPPPTPKNAFDKTVIAAKAEDFITQYDALVTDYFKDKRGFDCQRFALLDKAMKTYRHDGISGDGQRSNGNLTYRLLRRLDVSVPDETGLLARECQNIRSSLF